MTRASVRSCALLSAALALFGCGEPPSAPDLTPAGPDIVADAIVAPTTLMAKASSYSAITLTWTDNSSNETGFEVWHSKTGPSGSYSLRTTTAANATTWKDTGLTGGTQYCYKMRAAGSSPSAYSSSAC